MKNFVEVLSVISVCSVLGMIMYAQTMSAAGYDTLNAASDRVVFIKDVPDNDDICGDGSGKDEYNCLRPSEKHYDEYRNSLSFDYYGTSFYQATEVLKNSGGTIVICGPVYLGSEAKDSSVEDDTDVFTANFGNNTIKFTSYYNGIDYRETNGAKLIIGSPVQIGINGQSVWEKVDIETVSENRVMSFDCYHTLIGEGVRCYPEKESNYNISSYYLSISGGYRCQGGYDLSTDLVVNSGTYNIISAGNFGECISNNISLDGSPSLAAEENDMNGKSNTNLVCGGTTTVYGQITGTTGYYAGFSGSTTVTVNSGTYICDINLIGISGMKNTDGSAVLKINGGDFSGCYSINDIAPGHTDRSPENTVLDFSSFRGELSDLADILKITTYFSTVIYPEGITYEDVLNAYKSKENQRTTAVSEYKNTEIITADNDTYSENGNAHENANKSNSRNVILAVFAVVLILVVISAVVFMEKKRRNK